MNWRLCVVVMAVVVACSSCVICAEEIEKSADKVNELLRTAQEMMEEGKLDEADSALEEAFKPLREFSDKEMAKIDKGKLTLPFRLAVKWRESADDENARSHALKWYNKHVVHRWHLKRHKLPINQGLSFQDQQKEYSHALEMALAECGYDPDIVRKKYPGIAKVWAPLLPADLDGDGKKEFVSHSFRFFFRRTISVFFMKEEGGMHRIDFGYDCHVTSISVSDDDKDGKDEILLGCEPQYDGLVLVPTSGLVFDPVSKEKGSKGRFFQTIITLNYEDGKLVEAGRKDVDCKPPRGDFAR